MKNVIIDKDNIKLILIILVVNLGIGYAYACFINTGFILVNLSGLIITDYDGIQCGANPDGTSTC